MPRGGAARTAGLEHVDVAFEDFVGAPYCGFASACYFFCIRLVSILAYLPILTSEWIERMERKKEGTNPSLSGESVNPLSVLENSNPDPSHYSLSPQSASRD